MAFKGTISKDRRITFESSSYCCLILIRGWINFAIQMVEINIIIIIKWKSYNRPSVTRKHSMMVNNSSSCIYFFIVYEYHTYKKIANLEKQFFIPELKLFKQQQKNCFYSITYYLYIFLKEELEALLISKDKKC